MLAGLLVGMPVGVLVMTGAVRLAGPCLPKGLHTADLLVVGVVASIGFTVSLFFVTAAFSGGAALAETKLGAVLSFAAAPLALPLSRIVRHSLRGRAVHERVREV